MATSPLHCPKFAIPLIAVHSVYLAVVEGCTKECTANVAGDLDARAAALLQVSRTAEGSVTKITMAKEAAHFETESFSEGNNRTISDSLLAQPSPSNSSEELLCGLQGMLSMDEVISATDKKPFPVQRYKSCAVVSNSGVLSSREHGAEIDAAEAVFRFNEAPTEDFEKIVGKKETFRMINRLTVKKALTRPEAIKAENAIHISHDLGAGQFASDVEFPAKFPHAPLYRVDGKVLGKLSMWISETWDHRWMEKGLTGFSSLTSGSVGMLIALSICDEVKAYGMASSKDMASAPYHYYGGSDSPNAGDNKWHSSFEAEKDLWRLVSKIDEKDDVVAIIPGFSRMTCGDRDKK